MVDPADIQGAVDAAIKKGEYTDRKAAIAGLTKQLIDYQNGALKGKLNVDPVAGVEKIEEEAWKALLEKAGGDADKAAKLYFDELKKIGDAGA